MNKQIAVKTREKWVDDVKVIACILVALGHFFMSMVQSGILPDSNLHRDATIIASPGYIPAIRHLL